MPLKFEKMDSVAPVEGRWFHSLLTTEIDKVREEVDDEGDELRPLSGARRGVHDTRATGREGVIGFRTLPCYSCKPCREMRYASCKRDGCGAYKTFDLNI